MADFSAMRVDSRGSRSSPAGVSDCDGSGSKAKAISDLKRSELRSLYSLTKKTRGEFVDDDDDDDDDHDDDDDDVVFVEPTWFFRKKK